ncbi:MAG: energy transducer TonB [Bacteroidia bacterium]|nr:energy transducer TonB [Bacteroidia bacterium]
MKKLLTLLPALLLVVSAYAQELASLTPNQSRSTKTMDAQPVESFWFADDLKPLNYQQVLESIQYDRRALEAGLEGTVVLQIQVDKNGQYFSHKVMNEANPLLVEAVEAQVHHLQFRAPEFHGEAVSAIVSVPFRFRLNDGW